MPAPDLKALEARRARAWNERDQFKPALDDVYDYALPYRRSTRDTGKGENRSSRIFDHTAPTAVMRAAGRLQQDLVGPGFFRLEPGPLLVQSAGTGPEAEAGLKEAREMLARVGDTAAGIFDSGEWDQAFHEMAVDLMAGTGAMLILAGDDRMPVRFMSVSIEEIALDSGPFNAVAGVFWKRRWSVANIREQYPQAAFGARLAECERVKPETETDLLVDTTYDAREGVWWMIVSCEMDPEHVIDRQRFLTSPWLTPRYYRVPGETMGRGPLMLAMPTIKTANVAVQLSLQGAALATMGVWTAIDDGVFSPDQSPVEPGAFWKVARNGGALGPSVQRLPDPRIDLSNIVLQDLRMAVQGTLNDDSLPPDAAAVRSATEIAERVKRLASDYTGAFGRLVSEIVVPAVRRVIEILYARQMIEVNVSIDQLLVSCRVVSPLAKARAMQDTQAALNLMQMMTMADPQNLPKVLRQIPAWLAVARALGVPEHQLVSEEERQAAMEREAEMQALAMAGPAAAAAKDAAQAGAALAPQADEVPA